LLLPPNPKPQRGKQPASLSSPANGRDAKRPKPEPRPWPRRHLSFDSLVSDIRSQAEKLPDSRGRQCTYSLADALMSGFAMFSLKDSSLLAFQDRRNDFNMTSLYRISKVPSDTQMRELLDPLQPDSLRPMFNDAFRHLQRGKALQPYVFLEGHYLLSLDGTEYFSSKAIHCSSCLCRTNQKSGEVTYHHQMVGAVLVHPDQKEVIPLAPEPIIKQDGDNKNDCERNASKRLLQKIRREHPHLPLIVVEDALASNAPHIRLLQQLNMRFLLGVKPDDHQHLFEAVIEAFDQDRVTTISWYDEQQPGVLCELSFVNDLPLNKSNPDLRVNFLQYSEYSADGHRQKHFTWITDLTITRENVYLLMRGGRSRWKVENETFNTLKNQGYHFEHNYGHGKQNLSVVLAMLMMLAFLIDQTQQLCCPLFRAVYKKVGSKRALWEKLRSHFVHFNFRSMLELHETMLYDRAKNLPPPPRSPTCFANIR
jgi:hypothetical protein